MKIAAYTFKLKVKLCIFVPIENRNENKKKIGTYPAIT